MIPFQNGFWTNKRKMLPELFRNDGYERKNEFEKKRETDSFMLLFQLSFQ